MANPRKFSEKIALHNQKQAEETAKFEQIMKEVSDVTAKSEQQETPQLLGLTILGTSEDVRTNHYRESRNRSVSSVGPMRTRPNERRIDTSPYSGAYLSPPPDTSWRRTNSDSALHHSAMQGINNDRNDNSGWMIQNPNSQEHTDRPKSSCDVPSRVPGINIYPSAQEPGAVQIPIGNNTGSLPDLTSVHFPSPLHTPIDQEADPSSSPYSSSPVSASPSTLSPTSVPGMRTAPGAFQFRPVSQNHLSVPVNSTYLHHNKAVTLENSISGLVDGINYTHASLSLTGLGNIYQQPCPPTSASSPTQQQHQQQPVPGPGYRSPLTRPSPQSSPGLEGRHSAPSSPAAPSPIPDYYVTNHAQAAFLQQHFEQISMMDAPNVNYIDTPTSVQLSHNRQQTLTDVTNIVSSSDLGDPSYYNTSPSPLVYQTAPTSLHTTPNTPTSIPDIILTDFSDDLNRQQFSSKDLSNVISGALDPELFASDESLRAGLGPLDIDGIQMLSDPDISVVSDNAEDYFRLDRL